MGPKEARSKENVIWEQGAQKLENGARSEENYQGAREKIKKEQRAKSDQKGAVKIGKKEQAPKNGREQGEWGKMSGSIEPP